MLDKIKNKSFPELILNYNKISILLALIIIIPFLGLVYIGIKSETGIYILGGICAIPIIIFNLYNPKSWLYCVALLSVFFFRDRSEGLSALDVIIGSYLIGELFSWLIYQIIINKKKLIRSHIDWILLFFYIILPFNLIIATLNGVEFINWFREYSLFSLTLYYFPFREYLNNPKDIRNILLIYLFDIFVIDIIQFFDYYRAAFTNLVYAYQLGTSVRMNQTLFVAGSLFGLLFSLEQKKFHKWFFMILFSSLTISALIATFSRAFWIALGINILLILFYLPKRKRLHLISSTLLISSVFAFIIFFAFGDKVQIIMTVIENRFTSSAQGTKDISVQTRFYEYDEAINKIIEHPFGGNGMSKNFKYFNPIGNVSNENNFIHNGYLYLSYRIGIPLTLFYLWLFIYYLFKAEKLSRKIREPFYKLLSIGSMTLLILILVTNFVTTTFLDRDATFIIALAFAFINIAEKNYLLQDNN